MSLSNSLTPSVLSNAVLPSGFCAHELNLNVQGRFRSVVSVGTSDFLVLERNTQSVMLFEDTNDDGFADTGRIVASTPGLNHGLAVHDGFLYASTSNSVDRWKIHYNNFSFLDTKERVITNMNDNDKGETTGGSHTTRTLAFDNYRRFYISVGSAENVDDDSFRSRIRRFHIPRGGVYPTPIDFTTGEVFADGLRNEVGLAFDRRGVLWGVENSADNLFREDLGGDIVENNPADELNRFQETDAGKHWGYPYCWTEYDLPQGNGRGTVWAWPSFMDEISDSQCRADYIPPVVPLQAHSAPLGIVFYEWKAELPAECGNNLPFPQSMDGYAFIAYHGSWNRKVPTGYKVVYIPFDKDSGNPTGNPVDLLAHEPPNARWENGFRPVDVDFDRCGRLIVTNDSGTGGYSGSIVVVSYRGRNAGCGLGKKGFGQACSDPTECQSDRCVFGTCQRPRNRTPKLRLAGTRGGAGSRGYQKDGDNRRRLAKPRRKMSKVRGLSN